MSGVSVEDRVGVAYARTNKTKLSESRWNSLYLGWIRLMFTYMVGHYVASTVLLKPKLQALVYDILPSTIAIGSRKLSANEQFFVGAQTVASLLQTTQIISDVCFITYHAAYASSNKTKIV